MFVRWLGGAVLSGKQKDEGDRKRIIACLSVLTPSALVDWVAYRSVCFRGKSASMCGVKLLVRSVKSAIFTHRFHYWVTSLWADPETSLPLLSLWVLVFVLNCNVIGGWIFREQHSVLSRLFFFKSLSTPQIITDNRQDHSGKVNVDGEKSSMKIIHLP